MTVKFAQNITKKNARFVWNNSHEDSFQQIKRSISDKKTFVYFDCTKPTELVVDASPFGLGAVLAQYDNEHSEESRRIIAFGSRSLTETEQRYSQTERETLALVWGCEYFHVYIYGSVNPVIVTDHKPLVTIFNNPQSKPPMRLERWALRLQPYNLKVKYQPGEINAADYLLRRYALTKTIWSTKNNEIEMYVNSIITDAIPKAMT